MRTSQKLIRIVILFLSVGLLLLTLPFSTRSANLLQNDGFELPYVKYGEFSVPGITFDLEVAHDWERFLIPAGTPDNGDNFYYFKSSAAAIAIGVNEKIDGEQSQVWWSKKEFDGGVYQQVSGLTIGEIYGFQAAILQIYGDTGSFSDGKMFRSVGIDPYGGTSPTATTVIWGPEEGLDLGWFWPGVGTQALSSTMTVFIRVRSIDEAPPLQVNPVFADDAFMDIAPTTTLTLTLDSDTQVTAIWNGAPRSGFHLFAYEAQYRKVTDTDWTDLQLFNSRTNPSKKPNGSFSVEPGIEYIVRARTWHEQNGGDLHEVPGPWAEESIIAGGIVSGNILDNREAQINGAMVSISGAPAISTTSQSDGSYSLLTGDGSFGVTASHSSGWTIPYPISVTVPNTTTVVPLTITLRPPDDIILNGDFEDNLDHWQVSGTTPNTNTSQIRTLSQSLALSGNVSISQTDFISSSYEPILSFWYKVEGGDGDDIFTAEILGTGLTATNSFSTSTIGDWQHAWLPLGIAETYTGDVGVRYSLSQSGLTQTVVYLDEVSLGSTRQTSIFYLPVLFK